MGIKGTKRWIPDLVNMIPGKNIILQEMKSKVDKHKQEKHSEFIHKHPGEARYDSLIKVYKDEGMSPEEAKTKYDAEDKKQPDILKGIGKTSTKSPIPKIRREKLLNYK